MTTAYRAYSPTRDDYHGLTDDRDAMRGIVGTLNQGAACGLYPPDWVIQTGHITWKESP